MDTCICESDPGSCTGLQSNVSERDSKDSPAQIAKKWGSVLVGDQLKTATGNGDAGNVGLRVCPLFATDSCG